MRTAVVRTGDPEAVALGTPARLEGRREVAAFFDGAARAALPVLVGESPGAAWSHRGEARVAPPPCRGAPRRRADPAVLAAVVPRRDDAPR